MTEYIYFFYFTSNYAVESNELLNNMSSICYLNCIVLSIPFFFIISDNIVIHFVTQVKHIRSMTEEESN